MSVALDASTLSLGRDALIAVRDGKGSRVRCLTGALWITEDRSPRDTIVGPGDTFTLDSNGLALIMALHPATLRICERRESLPRRAARWLARLLPTRLVAPPPGYA